MKKQTKFGSTLGLIKLVGKYSQKSAWLFFFGILTTIFNSVTYIIGIILSGQIVSKTLTKNVFEQKEAFDDKTFLILIVIMLISFILYAILRSLEFRIYIVVSYSTAMNMRKIAMQKLLKMPISYYDKNKAGNLISTLVNDINNICGTLSQLLLQTFSNIAHLIITVIMMFVYSTNITLIVIITTFALFSIGLVMIKKSRPYVKKVWDDFGDLNAYVEESVKNMKITKTFGRQQNSEQKFNKIALDIKNHAFVADLYTQMFIPWFIMCTNLVVLIATALALWFKNASIPLLGAITKVPDVGFVIAYVGLLHNVTGALQGIIMTIFNSQNGVISTARINDILKLKEPNTSHETTELNNVKGHIIFNNVSFRYDTTKENWQLKNASFEALPGQTIALVGPTGAGKTTVINLLSKFYDYEKGSITIDGNELKNINKNSLNKSMAVVLQDSFMFKDTVMNNIMIGNQNAKEHQVYESTSLVSAHDLVLRLEKGYQTLLQNNDSLLSKGEKQLLSISRAILGDKKILILDEATSNIDTNTEKVIQDALANSIMKNKTSVVIAHRLSTIKNADLILFIDNGEIVERGNHESLLALQGRYAKLYKSQFD